ncbi:MAG TPA: helix-turn-helix transcriptional regulator [Terriglobia bacterium]|nr:helix-turn-helix transcriptional regulator [Terriglobia bacterium]
MELLHIAEAAQELGISYPTLKQWIYRGKLRSVKTAGGHHRIPRTEIDRVLFAAGKKASQAAKPRVTPTAFLSGLEHLISGRNQLVGRITSIEVIGLLAKVTLDIGGQSVTAIITRDACRDLDLKPGDTAAALIKATEVMILRPVTNRNKASASPSGRKNASAVRRRNAVARGKA